MIVLNEAFEDAQILKGTLVVALQEESTIVGENTWLKNENAG